MPNFQQSYVSGETIMARLALIIDYVLAVLKWPVAVLVLLALPGTIFAAYDLLINILTNPARLSFFLIGFGLYVVGWQLFFHRMSWGSWFSTLEHELTHAFFAVLTFHRVCAIRTSWNDGGQIRYYGKGNWLITLSPYFFPTISFCLALALSVVNQDYFPWLNGILGFSVAYHLTSTWRETHRQQPDLRKAGFIFAVAFLPGATLCSYILIIAFAVDGTAGLINNVEIIAMSGKENLTTLIHYVSDFIMRI